MNDEHSGGDFDWIIIGSGFGGSVSALRLAEKGYSVCVLECGRRFADDELPDSLWDLRNGYWFPRLGLKGITRLTFFKDVAIVSGSAVGGGSVAYANCLYRAGDRFLQELGHALGEPDAELESFYDEAERMLGVVTHPHRTVIDEIAIGAATDLGYGDSFQPTRVGIFFGEEPGKTVKDPFFGGEGPERTGCVECGNCLLGCKYGAKNHTNKNYLWLAERRGVKVTPNVLVTDIRPVGGGTGSAGYELSTCDPGSLRGRTERVFRARGIILAAGCIGTNKLLANCKARGSLPALSPALGTQVRSNAESIGAVTARSRDANFAQSITVSGSVFPHEHVHLEAATYGEGGDSFGLNFVPLTGPGGRFTRPLKLLANILRHPIDFLRAAQPVGYSRRTIYVAAMQQTEGVLSLRPKRRWWARGVKLTTEQDPQNPNPTFIPELNDFLERVAEKIDGIPQSWSSEALANIPVTAHLMGGAVVGTNPSTAVVDPSHRVFGYENFLICDGSTLPYNPGYNPSLTIAAMAERAMSLMPPKRIAD